MTCSPLRRHPPHFHPSLPAAAKAHGHRDHRAPEVPGCEEVPTLANQCPRADAATLRERGAKVRRRRRYLICGGPHVGDRTAAAAGALHCRSELAQRGLQRIDLGAERAVHIALECAAGPGGVVVYWHIDDVTATLERLVLLGARQLEAVTERGPGFVTASVVDPFGNVLGIMYNRRYLDILGRPGGA